MWGLKLHGSQRDICRSGFIGPNTLWDWSGFLCFSLYLELWMLLCLLYLKRTTRSKAFSNGFNHKLTSQCFASPSEERLLLRFAVLNVCLWVEWWGVRSRQREAKRPWTGRLATREENQALCIKNSSQLLVSYNFCGKWITSLTEETWALSEIVIA